MWGAARFTMATDISTTRMRSEDLAYRANISDKNALDYLIVHYTVIGPNKDNEMA